MINNLDKQLFSPLSKDYCMYFYILTVIAFVLLAMSVCTFVYYVIEGKADIFTGVVSLIGPFLLYFNNRLLYSMCVH